MKAEKIKELAEKVLIGVGFARNVEETGVELIHNYIDGLPAINIQSFFIYFDDAIKKFIVDYETHDPGSYDEPPSTDVDERIKEDKDLSNILFFIIDKIYEERVMDTAMYLEYLIDKENE